MNVVDSSGWLEYFADGPNASWFATAIEAQDELIVASLSLYEVFKKLVSTSGESAALQAVAAMQQCRVVDLDAALALRAAHLSLKLGLPLADSVILATARTCEATLWTQDGDFEGVPGVEFRARRR